MLNYVIGVLPSKEWKPKTSQKSNISSPGVIGSPVKSASKPADDLENVDGEADHLEIKLSQLSIRESENVIIAQHIRLPDNDRCRLMFGSFGMESDDTENSGSQSAVPDSVEEELQEPSPRFAKCTVILRFEWAELIVFRFHCLLF